MSLKSKGNGLKWLYTNSTYLKQGKYDLEIYSDSQTDLDAVVIYQIANANATASSNTNNKGNNEKLQDLFVPKESPATMASYKKINPTKYELQISNASRPYMLAFAESYDPQWTAHTITSDNNNGDGNNNFKTRSVPLYSIVNGFFINKTGDYTLTIEYQPQEWFVEAGKVSLIGLVTLIAILFIGTKMLRIRRVGAFFSSLMRKQELDN
jgi:hypothetical protein